MPTGEKTLLPSRGSGVLRSVSGGFGLTVVFGRGSLPVHPHGVQGCGCPSEVCDGSWPLRSSVRGDDDGDDGCDGSNTPVLLGDRVSHDDEKTGDDTPYPKNQLF